MWPPDTWSSPATPSCRRCPSTSNRLEIAGPAARVAEAVNEDADGAPEVSVLGSGRPGLLRRVVRRNAAIAHAGGAWTAPRRRPRFRVSPSKVRGSGRRPANRDVRRCGEERRLGVQLDRASATRVTAGRSMPDAERSGPLIVSKGPPARRPGPALRRRRGAGETWVRGAGGSVGGGWTADGRLVLERQGRRRRRGHRCARPGHA